MGHSKSDANRYRTREEIELWKEKCPIKRMRRYLEGEGIATGPELDRLEAQCHEDLESAVEFAQSCPYPALSTITDDVYA
jgi:pyruvate dehydrogenase E1 component alpha subunit